jgi:hypothetical protein
VTILVTPVAILVTLYWRGIRKIWLFIGLLIVCVSMFASPQLGSEFGMRLSRMF